MNNQSVNLFEKYPLIIIIIFVGAIIYLCLKIMEIFSYINYGKVSKKLRGDVKECKWKKEYYIRDGLKKFTCVHPRMKFCKESEKCNKDCKFRRFDDIPEYEGMPITRFIEQIISVITSLYAMVKIISEMYERFVV